MQQNAFEYIVWKMAAIMSGPQCEGGKLPLDVT